jgi:hypothetical protein
MPQCHSSNAAADDQLLRPRHLANQGQFSADKLVTPPLHKDAGIETMEWMPSDAVHIVIQHKHVSGNA